MTIFDAFTLLGGIAILLYGVKLMGQGLEKKAGGKLKSVLASFTSTKFKGFLLGVIVTAVIQSSATTTVMVVGFVNSGIMTLGQAIGVIMGANLGTSVTSWIMSLIGVESDSWVQLFSPATFAPLIAVAAIMLLLLFKKNSAKADTASILFGLAFLMFGMNFIKDSVAGLKDVPQFTEIMGMFSNPLLGVLVGALITAIIQSSAASVGILQAVSLSCHMTYSSAIPIIMGQNIGTCVTAMLSSFGANKNAKRAAVIHLSFNTIGTVVWLAVYWIVNSFVYIPLTEETVTPLGIAIVHSGFNILTIVSLAPFTRLLEKLTYLIVPEDKGEEKPEKQTVHLDKRLLGTPGIALQQCGTFAVKMAECSRDTIKMSVRLLSGYNDRDAELIEENEQLVDDYEDEIGSFLLQLGKKDLNDRDSSAVNMILHCINDFERISDHAVSIMKCAREMHEKGLEFSKKAVEELRVYTAALDEILTLAIDAFVANRPDMAKSVEPLEEVIDDLSKEVKARHVKRLRKGKCTIEMGFVLNDLINSYERVADHCSNIAVCIIEIHENNFETHGYITNLRKDNAEQFDLSYRRYSEKYLLP